MIKKTYPKDEDRIINPDVSSCLAYKPTVFRELKHYAEVWAIQIDITMKPEGIRFNYVKKLKNSTIIKRAFDVENNELHCLEAILQRHMDNFISEFNRENSMIHF